MNPLRYVEKRIRGWLPKHSPQPIPQKTRMLHINQKTGVLSTRAIGAIATTSVISSFFLLFAPYYLFPQAYIKKANSAWGYSSPDTLAAWAVLAVALALLVFSTLAFTWLGLRLKLEGSRWATRSWFTPRARTEREKRAFKMSGVANAVILSVFLGVHAVTSPNVWDTTLTASSLIILAGSATLANLTLYLYSKNPTTKGGKER
jgi:hypothetical protein